MYTWFHSISAILVPPLSGLHALTHDWGIAIIALTLLVKTGLSYFNLLVARQQVRSSAMQPKLKELRERLASAPQQLVAETMKLYQEHRVRPFQPFLGLLVQMPVLMGMYGLLVTHGSTMTSVLLPWAAHLAMADPYHVVPLATALFSFVTALIPLTEAAASMNAAVTSGASRWVLAAVVALLPLLFMWRSPIALGLYWMAGTAFGLLERGFYRTRWGRALLAK